MSGELITKDEDSQLDRSKSSLQNAIPPVALTARQLQIPASSCYKRFAIPVACQLVSRFETQDRETVSRR